jgi:hypothetical protein
MGVSWPVRFGWCQMVPDGGEQVCGFGLAPLLGMPASTIHAVLTRHGLHRLDWLDRPTGEPIRRYERERPGELLHVDVK